MFDEKKLTIRKATLNDIDFIVTTIIEAEKSSTNKIGPANYFGISEVDFRQYIKKMLEEEVDGCEFSISSFVVAEYDGEVVSAKGGWMEGQNEEELPSSILKANLFAYIIPQENLRIGKSRGEIVKDILIEREKNAYQFEYAYTVPHFRGYHIMNLLDSYHEELARKLGAKKIQRHVCKCNEKSLKVCARGGFRVVKVFSSGNPWVKEYYPDDTMLLLEKKL